MNTETQMLRVTITYTDLFHNVTTKSGSYDSLETLTESINLFIGADRVISIEFTK